MKRTLICLSAAAFAITLSIFACSGGGGTSGEEAKGCYIIESDGEHCEVIPGNISESECISKPNGTVMDLGDCQRDYEKWLYDNTPGSCTARAVAGTLCYEDSRINCSTYPTGYSFNPGGTCPGSDITGSCTYTYNNEEDCINFSQNNCNAIGGTFVLNGKCPGEDIFGACTAVVDPSVGERCYNNISKYICDSYEGSSFVEDEDCPGTNVEGACTIGGTCYNYYSQYECSHYGGSFVPGVGCPGEDIFGYCLINGVCGTAEKTSKYICDYNNGTFRIDMCPGNGSCIISDYVCVENAPPSYCTGNGRVFAVNNVCSAALFPYCYDQGSNYCYRIGGSSVSNNVECSEEHTYLTIRTYCESQEATIVE